MFIILSTANWKFKVQVFLKRLQKFVKMSQFSFGVSILCQKQTGRFVKFLRVTTGNSWTLEPPGHSEPPWPSEPLWPSGPLGPPRPSEPRGPSVPPWPTKGQLKKLWLYSVIHNSIAPSKELCGKMALGEVEESLPWWCHALVLQPSGYWGLFLNLIIFW